MCNWFLLCDSWCQSCRKDEDAKRDEFRISVAVTLVHVCSVGRTRLRRKPPSWSCLMSGNWKRQAKDANEAVASSWHGHLANAPGTLERFLPCLKTETRRHYSLSFSKKLKLTCLYSLWKIRCNCNFNDWHQYFEQWVISTLFIPYSICDSKE